ncbi:hypothetical protein FOA52_007958 [Chlamydomonas sp. UWO 241]|nr:hypothetical protein FOA52_007958 [Chlamydomonas sp. UWO 241]
MADPYAMYGQPSGGRDEREERRPRERSREERPREERPRDERRDRDRGERGGDRSERPREERPRESDRDRDRERSSRKERSRSRSRDKDKRRDNRDGEDDHINHPGPRKNRRTKFDILPPGMSPEQAAAVALAAQAGGAVVDPVSLGGLPMPIASAAAGPSASSLQATRHARRSYVGGLPPTANEQSIATFFSHALAAIGGNTAGPGNAVVNVYINREKNFSFVEFRTIEETSNAMALDGIMFEGVSVRCRRPNDYNAAAAVGLGPSQPNPNLNLEAIGLAALPGAGMSVGMGGIGSAAGTDGDRVFVGGLPHYLTDEQCRELLGSFAHAHAKHACARHAPPERRGSAGSCSEDTRTHVRTRGFGAIHTFELVKDRFGAIRTFELVKDRETGTSKGYGFVVYADPGVTDAAIAGLNGLKMGDRSLTVRRAGDGPPPEGAGTAGLSFAEVPSSAAMMAAAAMAAIPGLSFGPGAGGDHGMGLPAPPPLSGASRVVVLTDAVTLEEISDVEEYDDILEDMREECARHGAVSKILIPRPVDGNAVPVGLAKVIIEFADMSGSIKAKNAMHGRRFAGRTVTATFLNEDAFYAGQYDD